MKKSHALSAIAVSIAFAATGVFAGEKAGEKEMNPQQTQIGSVTIQRVDADSLDKDFTAKDLIGASVYDSAGERIGSVTDFKIAQLSQQIKSDQQASAAASSSSEGSMKGATASSISPQSSMSMGEEATVYISVGGLLGIGEDIIAVPASSVTYNQKEARFTLAANKKDVVAFAESDSSEDQEYSAKQMFDDSSISSIEKSLQSDANLSNVTVTQKDERLILEGNVASKDDKDRAQNLVESQSDLKVDNQIKVQKSNSEY